MSVPAATGGSSTQDALAGRLVLDEAKLAEALSSDPAPVEAFLGGGGVDGIVQRLTAALEPVTKSISGYLATAGQSADHEAARIERRLVDIDRRLAVKEERLRAQFTALETAMHHSQSHGAWLSAQLSGLQTWQ